MTKQDFHKDAGAASYVSPNRGLALLDEAIEQIELHAKAKDGQWYQDEWRCETGQCLAGWLCQLAGAPWAFPAGHGYDADLVVAAEEDAPYADTANRITASKKAMLLLNLDPANWDWDWDARGDDVAMADALFAGGNTLGEIKEARHNYAAYIANR